MDVQFYLSSFTKHNYLITHPCLYILKVHYFLLLTNIPLDYISQFYTSCFLLVIINKTAISIHIKLLCERKLTLSLLIHMVSLFLTSEETAKLFSNVVELCCFCISKLEAPISSISLQHLVQSIFIFHPF